MTPERLMERGVFTMNWMNLRGNNVDSGNWSDERYAFDFDDSFRKEWKQFDTSQDAWYYGFWTRKATLQTFSYCEGDVCLVTCPDAEHYNAEIRSAMEFHEPTPAFVAIDVERGPMLGRVTEYFEDREEHLI